jgi:hypothetical protein
MRNTRQEEFCNKDRIWLEIVPLKEKAAHWLRGLIRKARRKARLWNRDRNLCAMNQSPGDGSDSEGISTGFGVGRAGASATSTAA